MAATVVLLALVLVATATDVARHKIYNWTTYPGMLVALGANAAGSATVAWWDADPSRLAGWGWIGAKASLLGLLVCGLAMVVCFVCFKVGGGDVKLMAMLGAFLGHEQGLVAMLWTFVLGACMGLIVLIWRVGPWRLLTQSLRHILWTLRLGQLVPLLPDERAQLQPPLFLAPSTLAAVVIVQFRLAEIW
jgi:prepilin peptidase CpaA